MIQSLVSITTMRNQVYFLLLMSLLTILSCQEPIVVGGDLLEEELINVEKIDNLPLSSYCKETGRVLTFRAGVDSRTYLLGQLQDPVFGSFDAGLYFNNYLPTSKPDFKDGTLDSMDFKFLLDSLGTFGASPKTFKFELFQLATKLISKDSVYSDISYPQETLIGSVTALIKPKDSISVVDHVTKKIVRYPAHVTIPIDKAWAEALFRNNEANGTDTLFTNFVKGYYLKATAMDGSSVIGFNLSGAALLAISPLNRLNVYYNKLIKNPTTGLDSLTKLTYRYPILGSIYSTFKHVRTGSRSETMIGDKVKGNEYTLLQGAGGLKTTLVFDNLDALKDKSVVKAEIEMYVGTLPGYTSFIPAPSQLVARRIAPDGKELFIEDILQLTKIKQSFASVFGGQLYKDQGVQKYKINITNHLRDFLKDRNFNPEIILGILGESENVNHTVIYGAKHPTYPMKLRVFVAK
jgi:hypothetical protein